MWKNLVYIVFCVSYLGKISSTPFFVMWEKSPLPHFLCHLCFKCLILLCGKNPFFCVPLTLFSSLVACVGCQSLFLFLFLFFAVLFAGLCGIIVHAIFCPAKSFYIEG
uniref:Uncharacterized protein n=1 Tax=Opuntia streptacantha TaxID=393608 RepID=A0A7C9EYA7_OPUST